MNKRIMALVLITLIMLSTLSQAISPVVYAERDEGGTNPGSGVGDNKPVDPPKKPGTGGGNKNPDKPDKPKDNGSDVQHVYIKTYKPNFRTMQVIDVVSFMNDNVESLSDYRPENLFEYLESLPDFQLADIREYINFKNVDRHERAVVPVVGDSTKGYSYRVQKLIEDNILSRDNKYSVTEKGAKIEPESDVKDKRYENPNTPISRTDFLVELMKTEDVVMSPPIITRSRYQRTNHLNQLELVDVEPIETSPYQDKMGELGLDTGQTDVIISHALFGRMSVLATNDIPEIYLARAFNKGLIGKDELFGGAKGSSYELLNFLEDGQPTTYEPRGNSKAPRWALTSEPLRRNYTRDYPTPKIWEQEQLKEGQYPEKISEWKEIKEVSASRGHQFRSDSTFWGKAYNYEGIDKGMELEDWFTKVPFSITRKKSVLEDKENGYRYFKSESMTLMDAYLYASKHLKLYEGETELSQIEVDYLNSAYSLNMTSMNKEEKDAVNYLLAKGIIDGDNMDLYKSIHLPLTNEKAVEILWRLNQEDERIKITPSLTELDMQMLKKGYSQATVELTTENKPAAKAYLDTESGIDVNPLDKKGLRDIDEEYREKNKSTYDLIFIRKPKTKTGDLNQNLRLVVNDPYRTELQSFKVLEEDGVTPSRDGYGYEWSGYMVHKDSSSDLMLLGTSDKEVYTITGVNGEGFYWVADDEPVGRFSKWTFDEFLNNKSVHSFINRGKETDAYRQMKNMVTMKDGPGISVVTNNIKKLAMEDKSQSKDKFKRVADQLATVINKPNRDNIIRDIQFANRYVSKQEPINLWQAPVYLNEQVKPKDIIYGPMKTDQLKQLKYAGDFLAIFQDGDYKINKENQGLKTSTGSVDGLAITKEGTGSDIRYYIKFPPKTFSYDIELANFTHNLSIDEGTPGKKLPGYAQMTDRDGKPFVIISKAELANFGISPVSDKILENKNTGQRAFLNTDDNYTLIGNNLTHYLPGDMLVYAYGASEDHSMETGEPDKIFYNLNVVLELINDTDVVSQSAGKSISINIDPNERFLLTQVHDAENRLEGDRRTIIDQTYLLRSSGSSRASKTYLNLSALGGPASNFIYFKDRATVSTVEALIVYKPKATYTEFNGITHNTLKSQMGKTGGSEKTGQAVKGNQIPFSNDTEQLEKTKKDQELEDLKNRIINRLFIGVNEESNFIGEDYVYNIYILSRIDTEDGKKAAQDAFMARIVGLDKDVWDRLKEYTKYTPGETADVGNGEQDLTINVIPVATSPNQNIDLLEHEATGNLYMYMGSQTDKGVSAKQSEQYRKIFYQNMYLDIATTGASQLMFRQKHYYQNTPDNHIPLERYAEHSGSYGSMFIPAGKKMENFKTSSGGSDLKNNFEVRLPSTDINNNFVIKPEGEDDVGLFTNIELPWTELDLTKNYKGLDKDGKEIDVELSKANSNIQLTKMIYSITIKMFQDEINKTVAQVPNSPGGVTDGDLKTKPKYNISEVMKKSAISYAENKPDIIQNLLQGTWDGLLPERMDNSQFNIHKNATTKGIELISSTDEDKGGVVILAVGKNPHIVDSTNKGVKEGNLTALKVKRDGQNVIQPINYSSRNKKELQVIKGYQDLKKFANGTKIYFKPSLGIPHGTTLVDRRGGLIMRKHPSPREEVLYSADIINSLILRMQQGNNYKSKVFIHELDAGSVIKLGDNRYVMKMSPKQPKDSKSALQWVKVVTLPASERERGGQTVKKDMNDFSMMSRFLSTWGNTVTIPYNIETASVPLKSIVGKGVFNIPTITELNKAVNAKDNKASQHFTTDVWTKVEEGEQEQYEVTGTTWGKSILGKLDKTYPHIKFTENKYMNKAMPIIEIPLPPTISVTSAKGENLDYHYEVEMYHDIKGFNVDKDNSYIQYLRDRDTNAKDVLEGLEQLRTGNLDGMKYKEYAKSKIFNTKWERAVDFLSNAIFYLAILLIYLLLLLYVGFRLPIIRNVLINLSERFGSSLGDRMLYGDLTEDNLPKFVNISIACVVLATVGIISYYKVIPNILVSIWLNLKNLFY